MTENKPAWEVGLLETSYWHVSGQPGTTRPIPSLYEDPADYIRFSLVAFLVIMEKRNGAVIGWKEKKNCQNLKILMNSMTV